jgi:superfamily II DNA or RNA helicase
MTHITVYHLSVKIEVQNQQLKDAIDRFIQKYYTSKGMAPNPNSLPVDKRFVSKVGKNAYVMHTNQFIHMLHYFKEVGMDLGEVERTDATDYEVVKHEYEVRSKWVLRDYQIPICEFLVKDPVRSKMVSLGTGLGKTSIALIALAEIGMRIGVCILPTYIEKWVSDIVNIHEAKTTDIMVVSGSKAVRGLIAMARDKELTARYYIFSSRTMQDYITAYEEDPDNCVLTYGSSPFEFFQLVGIGSLLIDETHQHFHAIFKIILYSNIQFQLGLSATLISDDPVVSRVHKIIYTDKQTYTHGEVLKYTDVYALGYYIPDDMIRKVKTTNFGSNSYSHSAFENSMLKNRPHLPFYISLITANLEALYLDRYEKGDKCLIFVGTVKLATLLADLYKKLLPHLVVNRYCEDDKVENLYESDLIISTVISSGTAVDISNLRVVIQTVSISSAPQNIQNLGRLRKLDNDRDTRFGYLFAENIRKQVQYHHRRQELFAPRVASHRNFKAKTTPTLKLTQTLV